MSKYNNQPVEIDGIKFDSKMEAARYGQLKLLEQAGVLRNLKAHPTYLLQEKFRREDGKQVRAIVYEADFAYDEYENGEWMCQVVEDVKGHETSGFKMKQKMFWFHYPDLELRIITEV